MSDKTTVGLPFTPEEFLAQRAAQAAQPTVDERIASLWGAVNELRCSVGTLDESHYFGEERLRRDRWHATYNTALTGILQARTASLTPEIEVHQRAKRIADLAHGSLAEVRTKSEQQPEVSSRENNQT